MGKSRSNRGKREGKAEGRQSGKKSWRVYPLSLPSFFPLSSLSLPCAGSLTQSVKPATIGGMELVQLKSLFAELKQKASDLRGFL
jgi:hypothetical protein